MKITISGKGTGKTTALIQQSAEEGHLIVCHSKQEAHRVHGEAHRMGLRIHLPITYDEFLERRYYGLGVSGFLIDNAEMLLARLSPVVPVLAITITKEV